MPKKVIIEKISEDVLMPQKSTLLSGGYDIFANKIVHDPTYRKVRVFTGLKMKPEPNYMIRLGPRSSITKTDWILQNSPGLGDPDYAGEYELRFAYIGTAPPYIDSFPYKKGDRIAQMWLEEIIPIEFEEGVVEKSTDRDGGFGSTGK